MALIKCSECGKEISDKANVCIHCGCPIEEIIKCEECGKELKSEDKVCKSCGCPVSEQKNMAVDLKNVILNKVSKLSTYLKLGIIFGVCILVLVLVLVLKNENKDENSFGKPNIVGTWNHLYSSSYYHYWIEYTFEENGKAKRRYVTYGDEEILDCDYKFRNNNTEIKISCNYDDETLQKERNVWVSFEKKENKIYIDNTQYDFGYV